MEQTQITQPKKQEKKPRKLTKKEKGFVATYVETENATEAAAQHYDVKDRSVAKVIGHENLTKPHLMEAIESSQLVLRDALIEKGITPLKIAEKVNVLLNATETVYKNNNKTGKIEEVGVRVDYTAVDKGLKHATAIYGIASNVPPPAGSSVTYNIIFSSDVQEKVKLINQAIKERLLNAKPVQAN